MTIAASHDSNVLLKRASEKSKAETWKRVCSSRCYVAKTDRKKCKCRCGGEHHGKGRTNKQEENKIDEYCRWRKSEQSSSGQNKSITLDH